MKICIKCNQSKDLSAFPTTLKKGVIYSYNVKCKACFKIATDERKLAKKNGTYISKRVRATAPDVSVFSPDPLTGSPYITVPHASNAICKHILLSHKSMAKRFDIDDLCQDVLMKLSSSKFKPEKSAAKTFILNVTNTVMWGIHIKSQAKGRGCAISDSYLLDGSVKYHSDEIEDGATPEDYLSAKEVALKRIEQEEKTKP